MLFQMFYFVYKAQREEVGHKFKTSSGIQEDMRGDQQNLYRKIRFIWLLIYKDPYFG